jgi:hypothetical protein
MQKALKWATFAVVFFGWGGVFTLITKSAYDAAAKSGSVATYIINSILLFALVCLFCLLGSIMIREQREWFRFGLVGGSLVGSQAGVLISSLSVVAGIAIGGMTLAGAIYMIAMISVMRFWR